MACVESAIPIPNPRKKTDELFLSWLSEPSTHQLLRKELMKISGVPFSDVDENAIGLKEGTISQELLSPSSAMTNVLRPGSPISIRTPSPPHGHPTSAWSPNSKSPRNSVILGKNNRSPRKSAAKTANGITTAGKAKSANSSLQLDFDEVDGADMGVHVPLVDTTNLMEGQSNRGRRSRSHSPKPESLPTGQASNQIPKQEPLIPRFYFPNGKPQADENLQERFVELSKLFQTFDNGEASMKQFGEIAKASGRRSNYLGVSTISVVQSDLPYTYTVQSHFFCSLS